MATLGECHFTHRIGKIVSQIDGCHRKMNGQSIEGKTLLVRHKLTENFKLEKNSYFLRFYNEID